MANPYSLPKNNLLDPKDRKWKIRWIKGSKRKTHLYDTLHRFGDQELNDLIHDIVRGLIREAEIISNAYISGYR